MWIESRFCAGPQGTLFGKNASAGVVNIVTADPTADFHGYADGSFFGGGDEYRLKGGLSGTLVQDKLVGSFSGVYSHYDGNVDNLYNGATVNGYERYGGHGKLVFTPHGRPENNVQWRLHPFQGYGAHRRALEQRAGCLSHRRGHQ